MKFDQKKFEFQLPPFFSTLLEDLTSHGLTPILVGGAVRDFLLFGKIGRDWDIELTSETIAFNKDQWKTLGKDLGRYGKTSFLPFEIIRLDVGQHQLEFSPPRKEIFLENHGHKNFVAEYDLKLPFGDAVLRRDFTLNAMGVRFKSKTQLEFLDPLQGLQHLSAKELHSCGENFARDPVRFLRAIRFAHKYKFSYSPELENILRTMKVAGGFSPVYLWTEMQKSGDALGFMHSLMGWAPYHPELKLPLDPQVAKLFPDLKKVLLDDKHHESWMIALEWIGVSSEKWQSYFALSSETSKKFSRWAQTSKEFLNLLPENFQQDFELVKDKENFKKLFDWYFTTKQLLQKYPELPLMKMIETNLPAWIHLYKFEAPKDVKHIDPPLRAKYQVWNLCQRL